MSIKVTFIEHIFACYYSPRPTLFSRNDPFDLLYKFCIEVQVHAHYDN